MPLSVYVVPSPKMMVLLILVFLSTGRIPVCSLLSNYCTMTINLGFFPSFLMQVYYNFNPIFMLAEPFMLASAFFLFFMACVAYLHIDLSIRKSQSV